MEVFTLQRTTKFLFFIFALANYKVAANNSKRPNIVIFLADDLGIGDVGCFGNDTIKTPNIDNIAANGVKLTHFLAAAAVCSPSRSAFLTGRYPIRTGMSGTVLLPTMPMTASRSGLNTNETTFAELAKTAGYKTALFGKWHQGLHEDHYGDEQHHPLNHGFDHFYGIPLTNLRDFGNDESLIFSGLPSLKPVAYAAFTLILLSGYFLFLYNKISFLGFFVITLLSFVPLIPIWLVSNAKMLNSLLYRDFNLVEQPIRFHNLTQRLVKEGNNFLGERNGDDTPFLLFMSWIQVHPVLHTAPEFAGKSKHGTYGDNVEEMDWSIGEIMKTLEKYGMAKNTLVVFSSDHGAQPESRDANGVLDGGHNGVFRGCKLQGGMEGGIRVPTVFSWPEVIPSGVEINEPLSNMDIFPTVAGAMGVPLPNDRVIDGKDLVPFFKEKGKVSPHEYLIHYCGDKIHAVRWRPRKGDQIWKIRYTTPNWKKGTQGCGAKGISCKCDGPDVIWHNPPLIFDIVTNPREDQPISTSHAMYSNILEHSSKAIEQHHLSLEHRDNEMSLYRAMWRPHFQPCCGVFPYCDCVDSVYSKNYPAEN